MDFSQIYQRYGSVLCSVADCRLCCLGDWDHRGKLCRSVGPANQYTSYTRMSGVNLVSFTCGVFSHVYEKCPTGFTWCIIGVAYTNITPVV